MDSDMIADLKQFFSAELSQLEGRLTGEISEVKQDVAGLKQDVAGLKQDVAGLKQDVAGLKQDVARLDAKTDEILDAVGDIMAKRDAAVDEQISDHEVRITKLERRHA